MTEIIVKIMVEVLNIFAITTKEMRRGPASMLVSTIYTCLLIYFREIFEEIVWEEGNGRRSQSIRQIDAGGGSYGRC
jgi:hypothetical protein